MSQIEDLEQKLRFFLGTWDLRVPTQAVERTLGQVGPGDLGTTQSAWLAMQP